MDLDSLESGRRELPKKIRPQHQNNRHPTPRELRLGRGRKFLWRHLASVEQLQHDGNPLDYLAKTLSYSWKNFLNQNPGNLGKKGENPNRTNRLAA